MCEMPRRDGGEEDMEEKGRKRIFSCLPEDKRLHMETEDLKMCEKIEMARVRGSQWGGLKSPNIEEKAGMIGD